MALLKPGDRVALYMEGAFEDGTGKMGMGVLRYAPYEVAAVVDARHAGGDLKALTGIDRPAPIVASVEAAAQLGATVFVIGIAPPGGRIPDAYRPAIDEAVTLGLCVVNGLHEPLAPQFQRRPGQWIWDVRVEPPGLSVGAGSARRMSARRVLMIGTDMACGKMTAGLEIHAEAKRRGMASAFVATGQIGIVLTGGGVPLDAVRLDYASGAIEREVLGHGNAELIVVEGQGALLHPASTANLALLRGSCPTHLVLCHRAGQQSLLRVPDIRIPGLRAYARLYEELGEAVGTFPRPRTVAVALNTAHLGPGEARDAVQRMEDETGWPTADPVRDGAGRLLDAALQA